ncbi:MAG: transcription elongation factor GreA [Candidatus Dadabacteria bacterium]|nr:transcription elongation factor GreA [Candidatus Dadabacteria bacterium]MCY4043205.1 transcription elongation factor GreA [Candidatus Dadabacteria bacterium]
MAERVPITPGGYEKLKRELEHLKNVERPEVIKQIQYARSLGDLSENAEYETAKNKQSMVEGRIQDLEAKISLAEIIDPAQIKNRDKVVFGLTVTVEDAETGDETRYQLVGPDETDPDNGLISVTSPIGRALVGKQVDDEVRVTTPGGVRDLIVAGID